MCLELNAHTLIIYVLTIRDHFYGDFDKILTWRTFQIVRSTSSVFSTILNFSVLGLLR